MEALMTVLGIIAIVLGIAGGITLLAGFVYLVILAKGFEH